MPPCSTEFRGSLCEDMSRTLCTTIGSSSSPAAICHRCCSHCDLDPASTSAEAHRHPSSHSSLLSPWPSPWFSPWLSPSLSLSAPASPPWLSPLQSPLRSPWLSPLLSPLPWPLAKARDLHRKCRSCACPWSSGWMTQKTQSPANHHHHPSHPWRLIMRHLALFNLPALAKLRLLFDLRTRRIFSRRFWRSWVWASRDTGGAKVSFGDVGDIGSCTEPPQNQIHHTNKPTTNYIVYRTWT